VANILIADDEKGIRTLLTQLFQAEGHTVQVAAEGLEALKACRVLQFDVVFCDLFMPGMEGMETIRGFRKEFPHLAVVAMSGGAFSYGADLFQVARMMGAAAVLEKPFRGEDAKRVLCHALRGAATGDFTAEASVTPRPALL
jgi:CheY-like chemotaxis protein